METFKSILPIITFALGIYLLPYIEARKDKSFKKKIMNDIKLEIYDEYNYIISAIKTTNKSIETRKHKPTKYQHIQLSREIDFLLLKANLTSIYSSLSLDYRKAYKIILLLQKEIEQKRELIIKDWRTDNYACQSYEEAMIYSMLSLYYLLSRIVTENEHFKYPTLTNAEVVSKAAKSLNIPQPFEKEN